MSSATPPKYLVLDSETSGLFDFTKAADAPGQPRLASVALLYVDHLMQVHGELNFLCTPDGWEVSEEAAKVNGLTTEHLRQHGKPVAQVLDVYAAAIEAGYIVATYNAQFDTKIMRAELRHAGRPDLFEKTPNICLMRACTDLVKVPKKTGKGWKFPKLGEACAFFKIEQPAAHSAMGDAISALEILRHLHKANLVPAAEVHFAKEKPAQ